MTKDKKTRHYTIQTRWVKSWLGFMTRKAVPEIRISGIWLARRGFFPKDTIQVSVEDHLLVITTQPKI